MSHIQYKGEDKLVNDFKQMQNEMRNMIKSPEKMPLTKGRQPQQLDLPSNQEQQQQLQNASGELSHQQIAHLQQQRMHMQGKTPGSSQ